MCIYKSWESHGKDSMLWTLCKSVSVRRDVNLKHSEGISSSKSIQKTYILKDIWNLSMEKPKLFAWWESWKAFFHVIWGNWPLNESRYSSHTEIQTCSSTWGNCSASVCFGCRKKSDLSTCTTYKASFQGIINVRNKWLGQMAMYSRSCKYAVTQLLEC